jgi:hypothetical protein
MNKYISKYSKYETHFNRTDQWKHASWQEDETITVSNILAAISMVVILLALVFI